MTYQDMLGELFCGIAESEQICWLCEKLAPPLASFEFWSDTEPFRTIGLRDVKTTELRVDELRQFAADEKDDKLKHWLGCTWAINIVATDPSSSNLLFLKLKHDFKGTEQVMRGLDEYRAKHLRCNALLGLREILEDFVSIVLVGGESPHVVEEWVQELRHVVNELARTNALQDVLDTWSVAVEK